MWPYQWSTKVVPCLWWFFNHAWNCLGEWSTSPVSCQGPCYQCRSTDDWVPVPRKCFLVLFNWHYNPSHRTLHSLAKLSLVLIQETQVVQYWLSKQVMCQMLLCSHSNTAWHPQTMQRNQQSPASTSLTPVKASLPKATPFLPLVINDKAAYTGLWSASMAGRSRQHQISWLLLIGYAHIPLQCRKTNGIFASPTQSSLLETCPSSTPELYWRGCWKDWCGQKAAAITTVAVSQTCSLVIMFAVEFQFPFCEAMGTVHTMWLGKCKPAGHLRPN